VVKHSGARNCFISLHYADGRLQLSVTDDGKGFNPDLDGKGRNGVVNMQERAYNIRGQFFIETGPKRGSKAVVEVPL
jgi:signal transduction histidine kinase